MKLTQITPNLHKYSNGLTNVFFSYETPIAFWHERAQQYIISENVWTPTTGKHITKVKKDCSSFVVMKNEQFESMLKEYMM